MSHSTLYIGSQPFLDIRRIYRVMYRTCVIYHHSPIYELIRIFHLPLLIWMTACIWVSRATPHELELHAIVSLNVQAPNFKLQASRTIPKNDHVFHLQCPKFRSEIVSRLCFIPHPSNLIFSDTEYYCGLVVGPTYEIGDKIIAFGDNFTSHGGSIDCDSLNCRRDNGMGLKR